MAERQPHKHTHDAADPAEEHGTIVLDPVCGMRVDARTAKHRYELGGTPYLFCSARCLEKFKAKPEPSAAERPAAAKVEAAS